MLSIEMGRFGLSSLIRYMLLHLLISLTIIQPVSCLSGHGEQEDFLGHDVKGCLKPVEQAVHLPHPTEHEVSHHVSHPCMSIK